MSQRCRSRARLGRDRPCEIGRDLGWFRAAPEDAVVAELGCLFGAESRAPTDEHEMIALTRVDQGIADLFQVVDVGIALHDDLGDKHSVGFLGLDRCDDVRGLDL